VTWAAIPAAAALAGVAAAGILRPFGRSGVPAFEHGSGALEDERRMLLQSLRDLEIERDSGTLAEEDYAQQRAETEARAVAVLRRLQQHEAATIRSVRSRPPATVKGARADARSNGSGPHGGRRSRALPAIVVVVATLAVAVPVLAGALRPRSGETPITGGTSGAAATGPFQALVQQVQQHPRDIDARLALGHAMLASGDARSALGQYLEVLKLNTTEPEATATIGYIAFLSGHSDDGLKIVDRALAKHPRFADALYYKGVILLKGLAEPGEAEKVFRDYLDAAPDGQYRTEVQQLLAEATSSASAAASTSPSASAGA
jgi:cytochrome c-type biogenesis protein CcmH/NrfG